MANNVFRRKSEYSHVPTEQLKKMVSSISPDEKVDMNELYLVVDELERRDPVPEAKVRAAWEDFQRDWVEEQSSCERNVIRFGGFRRLVIIAAALVMVLSVTLVVGAIGFTAEPQWNDEHFTFGDMVYMSSGERTPPNYDNWYEGKEYGGFQEMLDDFGITELAEPKLPREYSLASTYVHADEECEELIIRVGYKSDARKYNLYIECDYVSEGTEPKYYFEKDPGDPKTFYDGERTYYLFSNIETTGIVWLTDNYVCSISGDASFEELIKIVKSIY